LNKNNYVKASNELEMTFRELNSKKDLFQKNKEDSDNTINKINRQQQTSIIELNEVNDKYRKLNNEFYLLKDKYDNINKKY